MHPITSYDHKNSNTKEINQSSTEEGSMIFDAIIFFMKKDD